MMNAIVLVSSWLRTSGVHPQTGDIVGPVTAPLLSFMAVFASVC